MKEDLTSACPMVRSAKLIGDEWVLLILRELFKRPYKFDELQKATNAATNILTNRLKRMIEADVVAKVLYQEKPARYQYQLTKAGFGLLPIVLEMMRYGEIWMPNESIAPQRLRHLSCGNISKAGQFCSECGEALTIKNLRLELSS
jgi:DNA-binding HxlR family transcriptional regulator